MKKLQFETRRFLMRLYRPGDYAAWKRAHEVMFAKQNEFDLEKKTVAELKPAAFRKFLGQTERHRKSQVIFHFAVFEKKTGRLMGVVLLALVLRFNVQSARLSYSIFNNYWKHGYGKEVVEAAIAFAFKKLKLHRLEAEILPNNRASIGLAKSLGFVYEGIRRGAVYFNGRWHDHVIYSLLAEDRGIKNTKPSVFQG